MTPRILTLSASIAADTAAVHAYLQKHNLPSPSFDEDAPRLMIPTATSEDEDEERDEAERARVRVVDASEEMAALMRGPEAVLRFDYTEGFSLRAINHFNMARAVPVSGETTFAAIANTVNLPEHDVRRVLRHGMTRRLFREPTKGVVAHTAASRLLAEDDVLCDVVTTYMDELWPAACNAVDAMEKWPGSDEPSQTGFTLAHGNGSEKSMWTIFAETPLRGQIFARSMGSAGAGSFLLENHPWAGTVVDVGGSHGSVMIDVAQRFPSVNCIVQDTPQTVLEGQARLPREMSERVRFMEHDFFSVQPVRDADIYFFRCVFHNWSDKYSVKILQNLIPALKPGAKVLVNDLVMPEPNTLVPTVERIARKMDVAMLQLLNSRERDEEEWKALFKQVDRRFQFEGCKVPTEAGMALIEVRWDP